MISGTAQAIRINRNVLFPSVIQGAKFKVKTLYKGRVKIFKNVLVNRCKKNSYRQCVVYQAEIKTHPSYQVTHPAKVFKKRKTQTRPNTKRHFSINPSISPSAHPFIHIHLNQGKACKEKEGKQQIRIKIAENNKKTKRETIQTQSSVTGTVSQASQQRQKRPMQKGK